MEFNSEIKFRRCKNNDDDMKLIFDWSNDEEVRKNSFSSEKIKFEDHQKWFQKKINEANYYILFFVVDGKEAGLVRLAVTDNVGTISYQISKEYRGKGYGKQMLKLLETYVLENNIATNLYGEVKEENISSQRIFEKLGYKKNVEEKKIEYTKVLKG